ncbi:MAG: hypothetical protein PHD31_02525 [Candidatus Pacebacteria bacterium]|nr:hypothetical protein [Candidatus Paceibacterota bacterium]
MNNYDEDEERRQVFMFNLMIEGNKSIWARTNSRDYNSLAKVLSDYGINKGPDSLSIRPGIDEQGRITYLDIVDLVDQLNINYNTSYSIALRAMENLPCLDSVFYTTGWPYYEERKTRKLVVRRGKEIINSS